MWRINFDRTHFGYNWIVWNPAGALNDARIGGNAIFRKDAAAVRLRSVYDIIAGRMKVTVEVANNTDRPTQANLELVCVGRDSVKDEEKVVCKDSRKVTVKPGTVQEVTLGKGQKLRWHNKVQVSATDGDGKPLYFIERNVDMPVGQFEKRPAPKLPLVYVFPRYLPSRDRLAVVMDCTAWQKKNQSTTDDFTAHIAVFKKADESKPVFEGRFSDFAKGEGVWRHSTKELPEGDYTVKVTVSTGGKELVTHEDWFEKRIFGWMTKKITPGDSAPAPYTPLVVEGKSVSPWGRTYTFGKNGLPSGMVSRKKRLLKAPATIALVENGKDVQLKPESAFRFTKKTDGNVEGKATLEGGNVKLRIDSRTEYDGFTLFTVTYAPVKGRAVIDRMRVRIPLDAKYIRFYSAAGDVNGVNVLGKPFPAKQGKVFDSSVDTHSVVCSPTFATLYWTGDYDTCFCYAADNDKGWSLRDDAPAVEAHRQGDTVNLYLNLVDKKTEVAGPRTLEFGLQTGPVKPLPAQWRGIQHGGNPADALITRNLLRQAGSGFTLYGGSWIVHPGLTPEMREKSRKKVAADTDDERGVKAMGYCYWGSISKGIPEMRTFRGEWGIDKASWDAAQSAKWPWQKRYYGDNKDLYILMHVAPHPSYVDTLTQAYNDSLACTQLYGFYDDTGYPKPVFDEELDLGFVRDDGKQVYSSGLWIYRDRWKRAAYVNAIHKRLDLNGDSQHVHAHFMPAYGFIGCWAPCEKGFYNPFKEIDNYGFYGSLERYAAINPAKQFGQVPMVGMSTAKWEEPGTDKDTRCMMMLAALHDQDVGSFGYRNMRTQCRLRAARNVFKQWKDGVTFTGYWESADVVKADSDDIKISLYRRKGSALLMIGNIAKTGLDAVITPDWQKLGISGKKLRVLKTETLEDMVVDNGAFRVRVGSHDILFVLAGDLGGYTLPTPRRWDALPKPKTVLARYSDAFAGPELPARWERVLHRGRSGVGFVDGKLYIQGHFFGYAMVRQKLDGQDNISAQCVITRSPGGHDTSAGSLFLFWKEGGCLQAGISSNRNGAFMYVVNGRRTYGTDINLTSPYGWYPCVSNAVKIRLTPKSVEFYGSADGRTWSKPFTVKRGPKLSGAPDYVAVGNGHRGEKPYMANVYERHFNPDRPGTTFFSDLVVGRDPEAAVAKGKGDSR